MPFYLTDYSKLRLRALLRVLLACYRFAEADIVDVDYAGTFDRIAPAVYAQDQPLDGLEIHARQIR